MNGIAFAMEYSGAGDHHPIDDEFAFDRSADQHKQAGGGH